MLNIHEKKLLSNKPDIDISCWADVSLSGLSARQKRRFQKHKAAVTAYFTTNPSLDEIAQQYDMAVSSLQAVIEKCLLYHEDGHAWGFRALLPGVHVVDHNPLAGQKASDLQEPLAVDEANEITAKLPTLVPEVGTDISRPVEDGEAETVGIDVSRPLVSGETETVETDVSRPAQQSEWQEDVVHQSLQIPKSTQEDAALTIDPPISIPRAVSFAMPVREHAGETTDRPIPIPSKLSFPMPVQEDIVRTYNRLIPTPKAVSFAMPVQEDIVHTLDKSISIPRSLSFAMPVETDVLRPSALPVADVVLEGQEYAIGRPIPEIVAPFDTASHPAYGRRVGSGKTGPHKIVRKRRIHDTLVQSRQRRSWYRVLSLILVSIVLLGVLVPLGAGLAAYSVYNNVRGIALDGVNHLLNVKDLLNVSKSDPMAALDAKKLSKAQTEFRLAESDFVQLQDMTDRSDVLSLLQEYSPDYAHKFLMARHLVRVALDVSRMGQEVSNVALLGASLVHTSPLASGTTKPLVSVADVATINGALVHALYYIDDIRAQMSGVRMSDVPISDKQKAQLTSVLAELPKVQDLLVQGQGMIGLVSWLLGVGHERRFLVQTMDRAELRPSGGFTGQYGVLQIQDGRMAPFSLRDVALLDYAGNGVELGRQAPPAYSNWMNFGNWGLRDSNLSGDYPTTARMSMQVFQDEGGGPVDGDISFTPTFIGHILDVTGPIHVAEYNETITSKNLEDRLHYYQQDYSAIAVEHQKSNDNSHAARKAFTSLVGKMLLDRVRHLSTKQLLEVVKGAVKDIQSHDLEIYFANPQAEQWLTDHGYSGATDNFTQHDGFQVVQANISISKASQFVHTTEHDDIVLDAQGGATHNLTITLDYQQTGQVYGFDTYADYIRVYVPQNAQFLSGDGFDTGQALCNPTPVKPLTKDNPPQAGTGGTTPVTGCSQYDTYFPSDARYCPNGDYRLGDRGFQQAWIIDSLGAPTAQTSDLPGHAMWGGLTETPKNCISTITLSWYVPHAVRNIHGQSPYALLVQKQGGYVPSIELKVDTSALKIQGLKPFAFKGDLGTDKTFALPLRR